VIKIALIAPTYLPSRRANTIQVMKMAQAMTAIGHNVRVWVPASSQRGDVPWDDLAQHYGLEHRFDVRWLPTRPRLRRYDYGFATVRWARQWGADLIYTRLPQAAAIASMLGMGTIYEIHDLPQGSFGPWLFQRFLQGSGARRLVVITRALMDDLPLRDFTAVTIAPDGVDLARYAVVPKPPQARSELALPEGFTVGYTGNLYSGRGEELIMALARCLPKMRFLLVGGAPEDLARLEEKIQSQGLKNIILTGFVSNTQLPAYQAACDVLLMPYQQRVAASSGGDIARYLSPMKLFEYLACGRAILCSDLPVLREVLNEGNAILLPPDDVNAWAAALMDLQVDTARYQALSFQARNDAQRYTWEARAEQILENLS
jgi:glycosyltransferase involved in cell wall biosynthesis